VEVTARPINGTERTRKERKVECGQAGQRKRTSDEDGAGPYYSGVPARPGAAPGLAAAGVGLARGEGEAAPGLLPLTTRTCPRTRTTLDDGGCWEYDPTDEVDFDHGACYDAPGDLEADK
jgi:hypothetical protein